MKLVAIVVLLAVGGAAVAAALGAFTPQATNATSLLTAAASVTDVIDEIAATGTVETASQYSLAFGSAASESASSSSDNGAASNQLAASIDWPVTEVKVAAGDHVIKGQVLATADAADLESAIAEARRTASAAELQLEQARADHSDAKGAAAKRQTRIALYNAQSAAAKAKADLAALVALRAYATITAPADGTVTDVAITAGADAPDAAAITMLSGALRVSTSVVESDIASIKLDQQATITVSALDASLRGRVAAIDPVGSASGSNGVVSFDVVIELESPPAGLRPGMSADITIVAASASDVLAIPSRALSGSAGSYTVRVVAADGTVSVREVEVGLVTSSLAEIKSGLQAGEQVVTGTSTSQNSGLTVNGGPGAFPGGGVIREGKP
jgi:macrolide-specific efflux system membrane fusion protein